MRILSADVGGTAIKAGICEEDGSVLDFSEFPSHAEEGGPRLMETLCKVLETYEKYDRIGLSITGQVDSGEGTIVFADDNVPGFTGTRVKDLVRDQFQVPVFVENDVNAAAVGEAHFGAGVSYDHFLCLTYGTGVGGAWILNGSLYKGMEGIAGEVGHMITHADGILCSCGCRGCYEKYASASALVRKARELDDTLTDGRRIFRRMEEGDLRVKKVVDEWIDEITFGLVSLVHIFNPQCIVLGGGVMNQDYVIRETESRVHSRVMSSFRGVTLKKAMLGNRAGLMGAAYLAMTGEC